MSCNLTLFGTVGGVDKLLGKWISSNDSIMAYLPLAHVLEFLVENLCLYWGVTLGYGTVRTLTDASVRNCKGDIKEFRPTILTGVPTVWESIRKGILASVNSSPTVKKVFERAFTAKAWLMERGLPTPVLDKLVFSKIKAQVGGRLRFGLSGGAPISLETQKFLSVCLAPILGGYGMTESVGYVQREKTRSMGRKTFINTCLLQYVLYYDTGKLPLWSCGSACALL
jgi:long-chain acyl-CoA synthetase